MHARSLLSFILCTFSCLPVSQTAAENSDDVKVRELMLQLGSDEVKAKDTLVALAKVRHPKVKEILETYRIGGYFLWEEQFVYANTEEVEEDEDFNEILVICDPLTRAPLAKDGKPLKVIADELEEISADRKERKLVSELLFRIGLFDPDPVRRMASVKLCGDKQIEEEAESLKKISETDKVNKIRFIAKESLLLIQLGKSLEEEDMETHLAAAKELGRMRSLRGYPRLDKLLKANLGRSETEISAIRVYKNSMAQIDSHQKFADHISYFFQGLSLGSTLILMALGLSITFGLMGVINMAHGELMMIGAYTTYVTQVCFGHSPDNPVNGYFFVALPASFLAAALTGAVIEMLVVRHLYRRPLESLLATWGVSLVMIQFVRGGFPWSNAEWASGLPYFLRWSGFGDNIGVNSPTWAVGSVEVAQDILLPYSRLFIILVCGICLGMVYVLMNHTSLGLKIRATMQNRDMANSLGVNTRLVDIYTFAFGSGLAGIAGCAWTLIGGVTPDMGQVNFIVDSFLVVVTGGVGELAGVVCAGLGIGIGTKLLEPVEVVGGSIGAIWTKILILIVIVAFIQFKPAGLFAPKGRLADV